MRPALTMGIICRCMVRAGPMSGTPPGHRRPRSQDTPGCAAPSALLSAAAAAADAPEKLGWGCSWGLGFRSRRWRSSMRTRSMLLIVGGGWISSDRGPAGGLSSRALLFAAWLLGLAWSREMLSAAAAAAAGAAAAANRTVQHSVTVNNQSSHGLQGQPTVGSFSTAMPQPVTATQLHCLGVVANDKFAGAHGSL